MSMDYCDYLTDMLSGWATVTPRAMFGGFGLYRSGLMFALIADDILYLKVDDKNRGDYEAAECEPFTYEARGKRTSLSYYQLPPDILEDAELLASWAQKSYDAALRAAAKKKLTKTKTAKHGVKKK